MKSQVSEVKVPERVAFVNVNSGKVFFDCHPAEARLAMHAIRGEHRIAAESLDGTDYCRYLADVAEKVVCFDDKLSANVLMLLREFSPAVGSLVKLGRIIDEIAEMKECNDTESECSVQAVDSDSFLQVTMQGFRLVEDNDVIVSHIVVNARTLAVLREANKDVWDSEKRHALQNIGVAGSLWRAWVCVREVVPKDEIVVASYNNPVGIRNYVRRMRSSRGIQFVGKVLSPRLEKAVQAMTDMLRDELLGHVKMKKGLEKSK